MLFSLLLSALTLAYDFPYEDPYYATLTAAILKADDTDSSVRSRDMALPGLPERDPVPYLGRRNRVTVRFWEQPGRAPALFLVAGVGGGANASYLNFLAYHFHKRGFHVIALPSAFHWSFALSRSRSAHPGVTAEDARDLYTLMQKCLTQLGDRVSGKGLLGLSMGALEAAYVAALDRKTGEIGFGRVLLVNPPVDVLSGIRAIDSFVEYSGDKKALRERVLRFGMDALTRDIKDPSYFAGLEARLPTKPEERKFLIGDWLRNFLGALVFTTQQIQDRGVLESPVATSDPGARLAEAARFGFEDYILRFFLPALSERRGRNLEVADLIGETNLSGIEAELRQDERVYLMHNRNDFIVTGGELQGLRSIFGARMTLYPRGGHLGNLWFPENLEAILATFTNLN